MNAKKTAYFMIYCLTTGQMIFNKLNFKSIEFPFNILMSYIKKCSTGDSLVKNRPILKCRRAQSPTITSKLFFELVENHTIQEKD